MAHHTTRIAGVFTALTLLLGVGILPQIVSAQPVQNQMRSR